jgi:hypothetical protein
LAHLIESRGVMSPAVIVIGEVVRLREKLNWFYPAREAASQRKGTKGQRTGVEGSGSFHFRSLII